MRALIIEDEKLAAQKLIALLEEINPEIEIIEILETVEDSINWFNSNSHPDLIFMDIQLNDGVCFEIFESINIQKPIIFTTAFNEYAIEAFKVNSIDYLLKPFKHEDLQRAIKKYNTLFKQTNYTQVLDNLVRNISKKFKERFFIKVGLHYKSILTSDINCFYICERNVFIFTSDGRNIAVDYSLGQLEDLINPEKFFRVNRNFIVNIDSINDVISYSTSRLELKISKWNENQDIVVSRERVKSFKEWIDK
ncbi:MAG: response regulator transcription factor [Bacteroidales bacterium]|nr:response regulator transcription factor [Bacteroidales bacterium]